MTFAATLDRPSRLGLATALGTAAGTLVLCLAFELLVPASVAGTVADYVGDKNLNFRSIIIYVTAGGMHILLCSGGIAFFLDQLRREQSAAEFKKTILYSIFAFAVICAIVLAACLSNLNIVEHSFHNRIRPLEADPHLTFLVGIRSSAVARISFRLFAVFPLLLTFFGVAVAIGACFWIAQKAVTFAHRADDLKPRQIAELKRSIGQLIALTTVVFTTSTIATIALMQIARDWIGKGPVRDTYIQNGHAMSIFWSANYTCVTALMVILPLWWLAARTRRVQRQAGRTGERTTFWDQIFEVVSLKSALQAGSAALAPLLTSSFAATFGS